MKASIVYKFVDGELVSQSVKSLKTPYVLGSFLRKTRKTIRELEIEVGYDLFKEFM